MTIITMRITSMMFNHIMPGSVAQQNAGRKERLAGESRKRTDEGVSEHGLTFSRPRTLEDAWRRRIRAGATSIASRPGRHCGRRSQSSRSVQTEAGLALFQVRLELRSQGRATSCSSNRFNYNLAHANPCRRNAVAFGVYH